MSLTVIVVRSVCCSVIRLYTHLFTFWLVYLLAYLFLTCLPTYLPTYLLPACLLTYSGKL